MKSMRALVVLAPFAALACRGEPAGVAGTASAEPPPSPPAAAALSPKGHGPEVVRPHHEESVVECPVTPPDNADDDARAAALLDAANKQIVLGGYGAAWTCADRAADLVPASVEAHHLRGSALAALGKEQEAQLAYSIALALDPDDPETLRAIADFYINGNGKAERGRDALRLGLELAQRGSRRVLARRRKTAQLGADLAVLEAQALNDLGRSDEALVRIDVALRLAPGRGDALHEKGVALFDLSRFAEARAVLSRALAIQPDDAYSHQILGLTLEQLGDASAAAELARAVALAPAELSAPVEISNAEFQREIEGVVTRLPEARRALVRTIRIEVTDLPDAADLAAVKPPFPPTILGLYRGPVGKSAHPHAIHGESPSIVLYRKNLARAVKTRAELSEQIRDTLLHEIGHLEGLDEDDLRRRGME
jgi:tetratricopeptide (TPR) repeat protein